ncbi:rabconnectin-related [Burkholderiales bacterium GJ-E10]|nr:rabconnectin-related [Burkholderiales bacterium GJ-E10]
MGKTKWAALIGGVLAVGGMQAARAGLVDPNFAVCGNSSISTNCGSDPNQVSSSGSVYAGVIGSGGNGPLNSFLLFVAAPDQSATVAVGGASFGSGSTVFSGTNAGSSVTVAAATNQWYGQTTTVQSNGYLGQFTSGSPDLYSFAGLLYGNASMNWANFSTGSGSGTGTAESNLLGWTPASFSIYEYTVTVSGVTGNLDTSNIYKLAYTSIPLGGYVAAWGLEAYPVPKKGTTHVYDSPFTTAAWVSGGISVPEPATFSLMGLGVAGLVVAAVRRRRRA